MFEVARARFKKRSRDAVCSSLRFGISGANRYSYNMRGQLCHFPEATEFFNRIERMLDSNDGLDILDIRFLIDFVS